jgi:hypothetical protein
LEEVKLFFRKEIGALPFIKKRR